MQDAFFFTGYWRWIDNRVDLGSTWQIATGGFVEGGGGHGGMSEMTLLLEQPAIQHHMLTEENRQK